MAMRPIFSIAVLALVVVAAAPFGGGRVAADGDPDILLSTISTNSQFERHEDVPPTSIHIGYGLVNPKSFDPYVHAIFVDTPLAPSPIGREFVTYVNADPKAASLAEDLRQRTPQYWFFGMIYWYDGTGRSAEGSLDLNVPPGTDIAYFRMILPPFTIEKKPQPPGFASQYGLATGGSPVAVEAWGPPPPGDANCDAAIDSRDALVMLQHSAGLLDALSCAKAADGNADGTVDARDAQLVLQYTAGLIGVL